MRCLNTDTELYSNKQRRSYSEYKLEVDVEITLCSGWSMNNRIHDKAFVNRLSGRCPAETVGCPSLGAS